MADVIQLDPAVLTAARSGRDADGDHRRAARARAAAPEPAGPWLQTASGRAFDLLDPDPSMVDFKVDVAEALARIPRFTGHVRSGPYSVAQHCALGADAILEETGDPELALEFLLHDAHEAYLGDIATPIAWALAVAAGRSARLNAELAGRPTYTHDLAEQDASAAVKRAIKGLKLGIDAAIRAAAGLPVFLTRARADAIHAMDLRMLATERRHLLGPSPHRWHDDIEAAKPIRIAGGLRVWPWPEAADEFLTRLRRLAPNAAPRTARAGRSGR